MVKDNKEYSEEEVDKRLHKNRVKQVISDIITLVLFLIILFLLVFGKDMFKSFYDKVFENVRDTSDINEVTNESTTDTSEDYTIGLGNLIDMSFEIILNKDSEDDSLEFTKETLIKNTANGYSTDTKEMFEVLRELSLSADDVKLNKVKEYKTRLLVYYTVVDKGESSNYLLELYKENGKLKGYKNYNFIETVGSIE